MRCPALSFVIPAMNEEDTIDETIRRVGRAAKDLVPTYEIIVVDDGSTDETLGRAVALCGPYPLRVVRLSRNFGKEQAIMAGLERSLGRAVVILDADLQEPLSALTSMFKQHQAGYEMVYAVRTHRKDESTTKRLLSRTFYKLLNLGGDVTIPPDARDFRVMDRKVVDAICDLPERNRFMKGLYSWVGFSSIGVPIEIAPRGAGCSKYGLARLCRLGFTGMTSFASWPLRVWIVLGMGVAAISLICGGWVAIKTAVFGVAVSGWSTMVIVALLLAGVQLISIGVLGEYLGRVLLEVKQRPGFIVAGEYSAPEDA